MANGASWVHFKPWKTKIGQKKSLTPFFHRALHLFNCFLFVFFARMREFFDFLPLSNKNASPIRESDDPWLVLQYIINNYYLCIKLLLVSECFVGHKMIMSCTCQWSCYFFDNASGARFSPLSFSIRSTIGGERY